MNIQDFLPPPTTLGAPVGKLGQKAGPAKIELSFLLLTPW